MWKARTKWSNVFYLSIHSSIPSLRSCTIWSFIYSLTYPLEVLNKATMVKWGRENKRKPKRMLFLFTSIPLQNWPMLFTQRSIILYLLNHALGLFYDTLWISGQSSRLTLCFFCMFSGLHSCLPHSHCLVFHLPCKAVACIYAFLLSLFSTYGSSGKKSIEVRVFPQHIPGLWVLKLSWLMWI